jgi:hypothetical protein
MPIPFTKQWRENKKYRNILAKAITTFDAQYKLLKLTGKNIETQRGINIQALGYLEGFIKSAMNRQQLDVYSNNAFGVFMLLYENIWGNELGNRYLKYWLEGDGDHSELERGIRLGGLDFLSCSSTGRQPMGWFSCFADEEEKSESRKA